jgi:hypothetical protein
MLSRVTVTVDGVLDSTLDLLITLTQLVITLHYGAIADFHTSQNITARAKYFQPAVSSLAVAW